MPAMKTSAAPLPSSSLGAGAHAAPPVDANRVLLADLIVASARGDERAFQSLYHATSGALFGMALRMLRRHDWAEEVLQESFVSVWRHAARYDRNKGAAMTWLIRIVRNQSLDSMHPSRPDRFERDHAQSTDFDADNWFDATHPPAGADSAELLDYARRAERIDNCLATLDARQRQSLALVFFHGLSHSDLARQLQQPLGTVKAWVRRGLARLANCLGLAA